MSTEVGSDTDAERQWMARAIDLATENVGRGGGPFGALVVRGAEAITSGTNLVTVELDPTAHAEITAIRRACRELDTFALPSCVLVTSCEPCPMCLATVLWSRVDRVLYAADRHDAAAAGFDDRAFYDLFRPAGDSWPVEVRQLRVSNRNAPFDAWLNKSDRVEY